MAGRPPTADTNPGPEPPAAVPASAGGGRTGEPADDGAEGATALDGGNTDPYGANPPAGTPIPAGAAAADEPAADNPAAEAEAEVAGAAAADTPSAGATKGPLNACGTDPTGAAAAPPAAAVAAANPRPKSSPAAGGDTEDGNDPDPRPAGDIDAGDNPKPLSNPCKPDNGEPTPPAPPGTLGNPDIGRPPPEASAEGSPSPGGGEPIGTGDGVEYDTTRLSDPLGDVPDDGAAVKICEGAGGFPSLGAVAPSLD